MKTLRLRFYVYPKGHVFVNGKFIQQNIGRGPLWQCRGLEALVLCVQLFLPGIPLLLKENQKIE